MVNIISGMNFLVDALNIDYANIPAAFSFRSNPNFNTNIIYPDNWAKESSSGILENIGGNGFFTYSGSGYFNGNNYFRLNKKIPFNNSMILMSYEKLRSENEILISSITGNSFATYSGFYIGINHANKMYLKYWNDVEGPFTFVYEGILADKNLLYVYKDNSNITLGHFNTNTLSFETQDFEIFESNFINNDSIFIGGSPNRFSWEQNSLKNFSGYIDRLYIFNNTPSIYSNVLALGCFSEPTGFVGELEEFCLTTGFLSGSGFLYTGITGVLNSGFQIPVEKITGYQEVISGYSYSGVTGYQNISLGNFIDNCGNISEIINKIPLSGLITDQIILQQPLIAIVYETGILNIDLTGLISGTKNIFVTGLLCNQYFNNTGDVLYKYDNQYLSSLSYKEISLLSTIIKNNDKIEIYTENYKPETLSYNINLLYDSLNENYFYIDREFKQNEILLFGNGQALIDSGYQLITSGYDIIRSPNLDYFITGITVETNKFFGEQDDLFYDYINGNFSAYTRTGNLLNLPIDFESDYWIFLNGQKLIKNKDYSVVLTNDINLNIDQEINYNDLPFILSGKIQGGYLSQNNEVLFVSSPQETNLNGYRAGSVNIFLKNENNNWSFFQKLTGDVSQYFVYGPGIENSDRFGSNIKSNIDNSILAISAVGDTPFSNLPIIGAVFIFTGNKNIGWSLKQKITGIRSMTSVNHSFGSNLDMSADGSVLAIGEWFNAPPNGTYLYTGSLNDKYELKQQISGSNNNNLVINNDGNILCFASGVNNVIIYTGNKNLGWIYKDRISGNNNNLFSDFGGFIDINNDNKIIAIGDRYDNNSAGSVSIYTGNVINGWNFKQKLTGNISESYFNRCIISNDSSYIILNGFRSNFEPVDTLIYTGNINNGWNLKKIFTVPNNDGFISAFAISNGNTQLYISDNSFSSDPNDISPIFIYNLTNKSILVESTLIELGEQNYYIIKEIPNNFIYHSGNSGSLKLTGAFNHGCSQVYFNGIKQKINNNYIENSQYDLLSGTFNEPNDFQEVIYNNTNDFFV